MMIMMMADGQDADDDTEDDTMKILEHMEEMMDLEKTKMMMADGYDEDDDIKDIR